MYALIQAGTAIGKPNAVAMTFFFIFIAITLGILLGALVIVVSWLTTWVYVRWANRHYDAEIERLR